MLKKVIIAGILGTIVMFVWTFVINGFFRFQASIDMKQIDKEQQVYEVLKQHIVEPGRYVFNPEITQEMVFPEGEPAFSVLYGGVGHEVAGDLMLLRLIVGFLAVLIGAWMLSQTSAQILASYWRRVLFFTSIGLLIALFSDLSKFGIGGYPVKDALLLALNNIITWTIVGLVVAWRIKPSKTNATNA